jgi:hypothetical protein
MPKTNLAGNKKTNLAGEKKCREQRIGAPTKTNLTGMNWRPDKKLIWREQRLYLLTSVRRRIHTRRDRETERLRDWVRERQRDGETEIQRHELMTSWLLEYLQKEEATRLLLEVQRIWCWEEGDGSILGRRVGAMLIKRGWFNAGLKGMVWC